MGGCSWIPGRHDEPARRAGVAWSSHRRVEVMADQQPSAAKPRSRARLAIQVVVSLVLVVAIFYYLLRGIDLGQVWAEIRAMTWLEDATLLAIAVWNLATYALVWMTVAPGLGFWRALVMTQSTGAVSNTVPWAGPVIGTGMTYRMLGQWGYSGAQTTTAVLVSGVWNSFAKLGLPVLALALLALQGGASGARVVAGVAGIAGLLGAVVVFALLLRSEDLARRFGLWAGRVASRLLGLVRRPSVRGWELATVRFRARTLDLLEHGWVPMTAAGGDREQVTAAVLVYRALTWFLPILVGVGCYLWWRRTRLASQPATAGSPRPAATEAAGAASTDRPSGQAGDHQPRP